MKVKNFKAPFRQSRRSLFKNIKNLTPVKEENAGKHHEYSIRPDTFAFKVSGANDIGNMLKTQKAHLMGGSPHPLQESAESENSSFNIFGYIYRNATNYPFKDKTPQDVFHRYPLTTSAKMARSKHRPRKSKMLVSDFIEDSLYNPSYGYFSKEVEIFHNAEPFDYNKIEDVDQFMEEWNKAYARYDESPRSQQSGETTKALTQEEQIKIIQPTPAKSLLAKQAQNIQRQDLVAAGGLPETKKSHQLWHTPTELFSPHYGEALARYILVNYKLNGSYPYEDLIIYEMGGGNGTLMCNILNFIKKSEPDIYSRTQYKIIEITDQLAMKQYSQALEQKLVSQGLDKKKVQIVNKSIFKWDKVVEEPCFFIALEVFDNFAHDLIRYDATTREPYQGYVLVDDEGDFYEFFTPELSYYSNAFLQLRENGSCPILPQTQTIQGKLKSLQSLMPSTLSDRVHPLLQSSWKLSAQNTVLPFKDNLTPGEFIPTRLLQFFQILKHRFPNHSLITSDFNALPNTMRGYHNAPVVQTIIKDRMVDVSTYMCHQGFFDIMFPTDFQLARDLYKQVTGKIAKVELHHDFLEQWADVEATTTKKGENPMLDFYKNASFMVS